MSTKEITSNEEFEKMIKKGVALIDFNAPWCGPCRAQEPILENLSDQLKGRACVAAVNIDNHQDLATSFNIQSVPTLIIFKDRQEQQRFVGLQPESALLNALEYELT
jgi:thioredoxin